MATTPPTADAPPRGMLSKVLTAIPVGMTILATVLAGMSSGEMTRAQYYRSIAGQNQSKAGDQWNFFQAKRIRRTNLEMTVDLLQSMAETGTVDTARMLDTADQLVRDYERAEKDAGQLLKRMEAAKADLGPAAGPLQQQVLRLRETAKERGKQAQTLRNRVAEALGRGETQEALAHLAQVTIPTVTDRPIEDARIRDAMHALEVEARAEKDSTPTSTFRDIPDASLQEAIQTAQANSRAFDDATEPINRTLGSLGRLVSEEVMLARDLHRATRDLAAALASGGDSPALKELRAAALELDRSAGASETDIAGFGSAFKAAQHDYTARRYGREGDYNQRLANLYEVQVRKNSLVSDRHHKRSQFFFYGMLIAQTGVVLSTLSLSIRNRSGLLAVASLAGLAAIVFAGYVYLYV